MTVSEIRVIRETMAAAFRSVPNTWRARSNRHPHLGLAHAVS